MATIRDVARHAHVSVATVSRVINGFDNVRDETSQRVQKAIHELGFEPDFLARSWRTRETRAIAAVIADNTSPHHGIVLRKASAVAMTHDYNLILCTTFFNPEIERKYLHMLRQRCVDGILLNNVGDCKEEIAKFTELGVPIVLLNRPREGYGDLVDAVVVDSYRGSFSLVEHLVQVGHRHIALVYGATLNEFHKRERLHGYRDALEAHGLPYDANLVRAVKIDQNNMLPPEFLVFSPRPTALFAAGYGVGLAAMNVLHMQGLRIPDDIAFAMYDDVLWGEFINPPLTLVRNPAEEMGQTAMELILARLADRQRPPQEVWLQPTLIVRRSCGWPGWSGASSVADPG